MIGGEEELVCGHMLRIRKSPASPHHTLSLPVQLLESSMGTAKVNNYLRP